MENTNTEVNSTDATSGVEEANTDAVSSTEPGPSVEDMAAHDYRRLLPILENKIATMPKKRLQRVIMAVLKYPLEDNEPKLSFQDEKEAFYIGMQINDCRFVLQKALYELMQNKDAMQQFKDEVAKLEMEKQNG